MAVNHPAARIARAFPAGPCLLDFQGFLDRPMGRTEMGPSKVLVLGVIDWRPVQNCLKAYVLFNGEIKEIVRNMAGEDNPNTPVDTFTLKLLDRCTLSHLPATSYVHDVVVNVVNDVKDGLVDRSAKALTEVGVVKARLDGLVESMDALPNSEMFGTLRGEVLAIKVVAEAAELSARTIIEDAESKLKAQARQMDERMAGISASNASLERKVKGLEEIVRRMLEADENVKRLDDLAAEKAAEQASEALLSLDQYQKLLQDKNWGQVRAILKGFGLTAEKGESLDQIRLKAENAYARQLQVKAAQAAA